EVTILMRPCQKSQRVSLHLARTAKQGMATQRWRSIALARFGGCCGWFSHQFRHLFGSFLGPAQPAQWSKHCVQRGADTSILPDVPELRPLDSWINAHNAGLHRFYHSKMSCHRGERDLPKPALRARGAEAEAQFIDQVVGTDEHLNLGNGRAILFVSAK